MGTRSRIFLLGILIPIFSSTLFAQAVDRVSSLRLSVDETKGFIALSGRDPRDNSYRLLLEEDSATSTWLLGIDGKTVVPEEDKDWETTVDVFEDRTVLSRKSRDFSFVQEARITLDGRHLLLRVSITNESGNIREVGADLLLDTVLGESGGVHFRLPGSVYITKETLLEGDDIPEWILSEKDSNSPALFVFLGGSGISKPDSVRMANWLRLREGGWKFEPVPGRNFDNLPYSSGDSAISLRYFPRPLDPGASRVITTVVGLDATSPEIRTESVVTADTLGEARRLRGYTLRERLAEVDRLLADIEKLLAAPGVASEEALAEMENRAGTLERRRGEYEDLQ